MRHTTRRNHTVESRVIEAAFTVADDLLHRAIAGIATAAVVAWTTVQVLASLTVMAVIAVWQYAHPADRRAVVAGVRATLALLRQVPGQITAAVVALVRWCDRQSCRVIRRCHDAILDELERSCHREEQLWLALRERPAEEPEPIADPWEEWQDTGEPVGRAA